MNEYVEYLSGYCVALMLALSSAMSVALFMVQSTALPIAMAFTTACFILNLVLFWQKFENIINLPEHLNWDNAFLIFLTTCTSIIMYAFTVFSFYEMGKASYLVALMFPPLLVHFISLCCAVGFFALYIEDFIDLKEKGLRNIPYSEFILGSLLTALLIYGPAYPITLFGLASLGMYYSFNKQHRLQKLCRIIAITSSMILSICGMGSSLPTLYQFARSPFSLFVLKVLSRIGLASLTICDAIFSRNAMDHFLKHIPSYKSVPDFITLGMAVCNALANSQITADGRGYFNLDAWLGGMMSFVVMTNNTQEISSFTEPKPPLARDPNVVWALLLFNYALYLSFSTWLSIFRPKAYKLLSNFFTTPLGIGITPGGLTQASVLISHLYVWSKMPKGDDKLLGGRYVNVPQMGTA